MFFNKKKNAKDGKGSVWYGLHFYPGVAEYREGKGATPYRVFLNEQTLREMDPTFQGRPVFVQHVDEVDSDVENLRGEADGWVTESFYNQADGKHWVKFITLTEKAERAIKSGWRLSNCYIPKAFGQRGVWNGVDFDKEITKGEYEHLAIVPNPRYEESIILDPEEFKKYNHDKLEEIKKFTNNAENTSMAFSFFKKTKVENSLDIEGTSVLMPKSKKEVLISKLINDADEMELKKDEPRLVNMKDLIELEGKKITIEEMVSLYNKANEKCENEDEDSSSDDDEDPAMQNEEDEEEKKRIAKAKEEEEEAKANKKKNAKEKAEKLKNAGPSTVMENVAVVETSMEKVARGKARYGS